MSRSIEIYNEIVYRIQDERKAIRDYERFLSLIENGTDKRTIQHILNEEKIHEVTLHRLLKKYREL